MKFTIKGKHTAEYGEFPYTKFEELERYLHDEHCHAVERVEPTSVETADIHVSAGLVKNMKTHEVVDWLRRSMKHAKEDLCWNCWDENTIC
jgi:hypothetical protein